ncbi:hypothetical protein [Pseudomonas frederiksbergensis]|uniref:Uncharacterized protein n=1 Tax=Pseudomonas frederiksbergensis TaxID=104087 RepID=A0A423KIZ1_9PSED|nr:hypothetical protein [Pseudomonas frederiksbergensis]RON53123.1 hypothetical protein BK665_15840 [Pseudomonas frederiksbergensis]
MATKTSKRVGESSTTVSVGIRIDPKIKFALDIMGRLQKRSLTAVIEWAISNAIAQQTLDVDGRTLATVLDKVWSTDESGRLVLLALNLPEALTYDELRIWETIKATSGFWKASPDDTFNPVAENINVLTVSLYWPDLLSHVKKFKTSSTIVPMNEGDIIPFPLK